MIIPKPLEHFIEILLPRKKRFDLKNQMKKTIKHAELGLRAKLKTVSRKFIAWLNCLGHCISYHEVNLVETAITEEQINNFSTAAFVPNATRPSEFVTFD